MTFCFLSSQIFAAISLQKSCYGHPCETHKAVKVCVPARVWVSIFLIPLFVEKLLLSQVGGVGVWRMLLSSSCKYLLLKVIWPNKGRQQHQWGALVLYGASQTGHCSGHPQVTLQIIQDAVMELHESTKWTSFPHGWFLLFLTNRYVVTGTCGTK